MVLRPLEDKIMAENVIIADDDANTQLTRFSVFYEKELLFFIFHHHPLNY